MMSAAFIVDGRMEQMIVQRICPGAPVRTANLNGKAVSSIAIAKRAASLIRLFKGRHYPVILIVDREARQLSSVEFEEELKICLREEQIDTNNVIISVPDRMIENWILGCCVRLPENIASGCANAIKDGEHGKNVLSAAYKSIGDVYHETTKGVELFMKVHPNFSSSENFVRFSKNVASICGWLRRSVE